MTKEEFEQILRNRDWGIVVWSKDKAYKTQGFNDSCVSLESIYGFYSSDTLTEENCEEYSIALSGEGQAILALAKQQVLGKLKEFVSQL